LEKFEAYKTIQERISTRNYSSHPVEAPLRRELEEYTENMGSGPFGTKPRFKILDMEPLDKKELRGLGTYGFIKNARLYLLSAVKDNPRAMEDLGYSLEKAILKTTSLGLGTCWLGGTFKRAAFARKMDLQPGELLPAITPVGYPADEPNPANHPILKAVKAKRRKPWAELFFSSNGKTSLSKNEAEPYQDPLEAVRLGPSASNRQPWRIIKDEAGHYHLYLMENKIYNRILGKIRLQNVDMGIAMCHFEMVAREQSLSGKWIADPGTPKLPKLQYIATWSD